MPLVKNAQAATLAREAFALDLGDLRRLANELIERAHQEAERIIQHGREEARAIIDSAESIGYERGHARGLEDGRVAGQNEGRQQVIEELKPRLDELVTRWITAAEKFEADRHRMMIEARQDVLKLALAIGKRVVHRFPKVDPGIVRDQIESVLGLILTPSIVTISISPEDRELIDAAAPTWSSLFTNCREVILREDASLERGGCMIRAGRGVIDARLDVQIERIVESLLPENVSSEAS